MAAGLLRYKVADVRKKIPVYSDNVRWVETLIQNKGEFFALDTRPYTELMNEYGVFYTMTKSNPIKPNRGEMAAAKNVKYPIAGSGTIDSDGIFVTEKGAQLYARKNMPSDLKAAGFSASVNLGTDIYNGKRRSAWIVNYGKAVKHNPIKRTGISKTRYVKRPSQATGKTPTKRLQKRRAASPRQGMFPNPATRWAYDVRDADLGQYTVHARRGKSYASIAVFKDYRKAVEYAQAYSNAHNVGTKVTGAVGKAGSRAKSGVINRAW